MNKIYYPGMWPKKLSPTQRRILENVRDGRPMKDGIPKHGYEPAYHVVMSNGLVTWGLDQADAKLTSDGTQALVDGHYRDRNKDYARALRYGKKRPPRPPNIEQPPLNARRLVLESGIWRFMVTRRYVSIWSPSGKRHEVAKERPVAVSICGCGEPYNCLPERAVTPGSLRRYIEQHLLDA